MAVQGISWSGVVLRIVLAIALVLATYNPSGHSFYHWLTEPPAGITAVKALLGVVLLIGGAVSLRTVHVALGSLGVVLGVAFLAALAWVFVEQRWLDLDTPSSVAWLALLILGTVLGLGLSWSLMRARLTGQVEVQ
jgi:drug/metabolite transporter (DMT)-like permease